MLEVVDTLCSLQEREHCTDDSDLLDNMSAGAPSLRVDRAKAVSGLGSGRMSSAFTRKRVDYGMASTTFVRGFSIPSMQMLTAEVTKT